MTANLAISQLLWQSTWVVTIVALSAAALCRVLPNRPSARHGLWLVVLAWFIAPMLLPRAAPDTSTTLLRPFGAEEDARPRVHGFRSLRDLHPWLHSAIPSGSTSARGGAGDGVFGVSDGAINGGLYDAGGGSSAEDGASNGAFKGSFNGASDGARYGAGDGGIHGASDSGVEDVRNDARNDVRNGDVHGVEDGVVGIRVAEPRHAVGSLAQSASPEHGAPALRRPRADSVEGRPSAHGSPSLVWPVPQVVRSAPSIDLGRDPAPVAAPVGSEGLSVLDDVRRNVREVMGEWAPIAASVRELLLSVPTIPPALWLGGAALFVLWSLASILIFRLRTRRVVQTPRWVEREVSQLSAALGLSVEPLVRLVDARISPLVWCIGRPTVYLPVGLWMELDDAGRRAVLCHELAHLRRRDHWVSRVELVIGILYWWHPVVWWVRSRIRAEADLCCDAWVAWLMPRSRRAYAEALLHTRTFVSGGGAPTAGMAAASPGARELARRITMVMTQRSGPRSPWIGIGVASALAGLGFAVTPALSCPPEEKAKVEAEVRAAAAKAEKTARKSSVAAAKAAREATVAATRAARDSELDAARVAGGVRVQSGPDGATMYYVDSTNNPLTISGTTTPVVVVGEPEAYVYSTGKHAGSPFAAYSGGGGSGGASGAWARTPQPPDDGAKEWRLYKIDGEKREALWNLMSRQDVPTYVRLHSDGIEVEATPRQHEAFRVFVSMLSESGSSGWPAAPGQAARRRAPGTGGGPTPRMGLPGAPSAPSVPAAPRMRRGFGGTAAPTPPPAPVQPMAPTAPVAPAPPAHLHEAFQELMRAGKPEAAARLSERLRSMQHGGDSLRRQVEALERQSEQLREQAERLREKAEELRERMESLRSEAGGQSGERALLMLERELARLDEEADRIESRADDVDSAAEQLSEREEEIAAALEEAADAMEIELPDEVDVEMDADDADETDGPDAAPLHTDLHHAAPLVNVSDELRAHIAAELLLAREQIAAEVREEVSRALRAALEEARMEAESGEAKVTMSFLTDLLSRKLGGGAGASPAWMRALQPGASAAPAESSRPVQP